jgi:hypothetical protein
MKTTARVLVLGLAAISVFATRAGADDIQKQAAAKSGETVLVTAQELDAIVRIGGPPDHHDHLRASGRDDRDQAGRFRDRGRAPQGCRHLLHWQDGAG